MRRNESGFMGLGVGFRTKWILASVTAAPLRTSPSRGFSIPAACAQPGLFEAGETPASVNRRLGDSLG